MDEIWSYYEMCLLTISQVMPIIFGTLAFEYKVDDEWSDSGNLVLRKRFGLAKRFVCDEIESQTLNRAFSPPVANLLIGFFKNNFLKYLTTFVLNSYLCIKYGSIQE